METQSGICEICIARSLWTFVRKIPVGTIIEANNEVFKAMSNQSGPKRKGLT